MKPKFQNRAVFKLDLYRFYSRLPFIESFKFQLGFPVFEKIKNLFKLFFCTAKHQIEKLKRVKKLFYLYKSHNCFHKN